MKYAGLLIPLILLGGCPNDPVPPDEGEDPACVNIREEPNGYIWQLPVGFPRPRIPSDNPMSDVKVELGLHLFHDRRLSENETQACASCHEQERAFTDGRTFALGSTGEDHPRNAMGLTNVAYLATYGWANPALIDLESQAVVPMFGDKPVELGLRGKEELLLERLRAEPRYQQLFPRAFPGEADPFSVTNVVRAISAFERTLISGSSPYDRFVAGDTAALSESAERGRLLFGSEKLECFHCHNGFNFQDSVNHACKSSLEIRFHNTGLYNIDGAGAYPAPNTGVHEISGRASDMGRFRAPTLRNIAVTAPYMHDGSIATLSEVLDHYAAGGRTISGGPFAGVGSANPYKSALLVGFEITEEERRDVIAFLESLTDEVFLNESRFADPWGRPCEHCD
jgi:cytochrome c peroxidase